MFGSASFLFLKGAKFWCYFGDAPGSNGDAVEKNRRSAQEGLNAIANRTNHA